MTNSRVRFQATQPAEILAQPGDFPGRAINHLPSAEFTRIQVDRPIATTPSSTSPGRVTGRQPEDNAHDTT